MPDSKGGQYSLPYCNVQVYALTHMKNNLDLGEKVFEGDNFCVYHNDVKMADGIIRTLETAACSDVVRVYPIDDADNVLLIEEYSYVLNTDLLRCVSGQIGEAETPEQAAQRELQEEIGMEAAHLECFATSRPIIKVDCNVYHFLATGLQKRTRNVNEGELIVMVKHPLKDVPRLVSENKVREDIIAYNLLRLYQKLKSEKACHS